MRLTNEAVVIPEPGTDSIVLELKFCVNEGPTEPDAAFGLMMFHASGGTSSTLVEFSKTPDINGKTHTKIENDVCYEYRHLFALTPDVQNVMGMLSGFDSTTFTRNLVIRSATNEEKRSYLGENLNV